MGVGEMGQIIGETGVGEMGVGEMGVIHDISLYINCVFYCCCSCVFVTMST